MLAEDPCPPISSPYPTHSPLPPSPGPARHSLCWNLDQGAACLPARACWTLLGFGICTGTVAGTLLGLLTGPPGREALGEKRGQSLMCGADLAETGAGETPSEEDTGAAEAPLWFHFPQLPLCSEGFWCSLFFKEKIPMKSIWKEEQRDLTFTTLRPKLTKKENLNT